MKKIKYISSVFVITFIFFFIGDMYVWNIDSFESEYIRTTMYQPRNMIKKEMLKEIKESAEKNNCKLFIVSRNIKTIYSEDVIIYAMNGVENILCKRSSVERGNFHSIFLGNVRVRIADFTEFPEENELEDFYIIGNLNSARKMKSQLIDKYGGSIPKPGYVYLHSIRNVIFVWVIGMLFVLLLTFFETSLLKKEMIVRFFYGESPLERMMKNIGFDCVFYWGYSAIIFCVLKFVLGINVDYHMRVTIIGLLLVSFINSLIYLRVLFTDYKSSLSIGKGDQNVLKVSYAFKIIITVLIVTLMSFSIEMAVRGCDYWKQKDFFIQQKRYSYISVTAKEQEIKKTEKLMLDLYKAKSRQGKTFLNVYLDNGMFTGSPCIMCNKGTLDYLKTNIKEIKNKTFDNKIYFIVPDCIKQTAILDLENLLQMYMGQKDNYEVITYDKSNRIIGITNQGKIQSKYYRDPLIILNMTETAQFFNGIYITQACMFLEDNIEWQSYITQDDILKEKSFITNVYDNYEHNLINYQRILLLGLVLFGLLFILEAIVIKTVLHYECTINIVEIAIKTTLGDSVLEKYKKLFMSTFISFLISAAVCIAVAQYLKFNSVYGMICALFILYLLDISISIHAIRHIEKANMQKILKGNIFLN